MAPVKLISLLCFSSSAFLIVEGIEEKLFLEGLILLAAVA
jgi:hypothetical protein